MFKEKLYVVPRISSDLIEMALVSPEMILPTKIWLHLSEHY